MIEGRWIEKVVQMIYLYVLYILKSMWNRNTPAGEIGTNIAEKPNVWKRSIPEVTKSYTMNSSNSSSICCSIRCSNSSSSSRAVTVSVVVHILL